MKTLLVFLALSATALAADRPNLIFVLSDDFAQGDLGCYGQKLIQTPNLAEKPDLVAKAESLMQQARTDDPNWPLTGAQKGGKKAAAN